MQENKNIQIKVCPMFVARDSQLANVDDVFNGIMVRGDATGDVVFYGKGAGKLPTASAVVADVIDSVKKKASSIYWEDAKEGFVEDSTQNKTQMYIRAEGISAEEILIKAEEIFGDIQELTRKNQPENEAAFVTADLPETVIAEKLEVLASFGINVLGTVRISDY